MGLVADAQAEARKPHVLRVLDDPHGLVGREDDHHRVGKVPPRPLVALAQARRVRVRREGEVDDAVEHVVLRPRLGRLSVGAHDEGAHLHARLVGPLAHRLVDEGDGGCAEQDVRAALVAEALLCEPQGHERLARAARHDRLGAVVGLEARLYLLYRLGLVGPGAVGSRDARPPVLGVAAHEQRPVDVRLPHVRGREHGGVRAPVPPEREQVLVDVLGDVLADGGHDEPRVGVVRLRRREERGQVLVRELVGGVVVLALDRPVGARPVRALGDDVDASVVARAERVLGVVPAPHPAHHLLHGGVVPQVPCGDALPEVALLRVGAVVGREVVQHVVEGDDLGLVDGHVCS